jgi:hypothetical protein
VKRFTQHINEISSKYNQTGFILPNGSIQKIPEEGHYAFAKKIGHEDATDLILKEPYIRFHWVLTNKEFEFNFEFNPKFPGIIDRVIKFLKKEYFEPDALANTLESFAFDLMTSERSRRSTSKNTHLYFETYRDAMKFLQQLKSKY